jgi:diguanylate cyclase (GGDEF)-like protein
MPFPKPPYSITQYAVGFSIVLALILLAISTWTFSALNRVDQQITATNQQAAKTELTEAIAEVRRKAERNAREIANWDETRQQLANPVYYVYWRTARIRESGLISNTIEAVELYGANKKAISAPLAISRMPAVIPGQPLPSALIKNDAGNILFYYFFPIYADEAQQILLGYGGLRMNFMTELTRLHGFRNIDLHSVRLSIPSHQYLDTSQTFSAIHYKPLKNSASDALREIILAVMLRFSLVLIATVSLAYWLIIWRVARPLQSMSRYIDELHSGRQFASQIVLPGKWGVAELEKVRISLTDYHSRLIDAQMNLENKNQEFWDQAHRDTLTGIYNRRAFDKDWDLLFAPGMIKRARSVAFILFDCDHFKPINDTYGHQVGDLVLRGIAESLNMALRSGDKLYRLGGDEFATLLYDAELTQARLIAERCQDLLTRRDFTQHGVMEPVHISIGIAYSSDGDVNTLGKLHKQADIAMYSAKRPGRNKIAVYSQELSTAGMTTLVANKETSAVFQAIAAPHLLEIHYQPVVNLATHKVDYHEALVRIRHGEKLIYPFEIFPVVEARRLEVEFDMVVIGRVEEALAGKLLPHSGGVSINLSGPSIIHPDIHARLLQLAPHIAYYKLVLEITETALITQIEQATINLNQLRQAGFHIALDDFGSGYSSLGYLSSMPVDTVKFDISMIRQLIGQDRQSKVVKDMVRMIQDAGYQLVAEGVETELIMEKVSEAGFTHAQGYWYGRPAVLSPIRGNPLMST